MQLTKVSSALVQVLPSTYDKNKTYPLIIFGHGQGGQWSIDSLEQGELPLVVQQSADVYGFVVLAPWTPGSWAVSHYDMAVAYARANLSIDWKRVYLGGLSMGGELVTEVISTDRASQIAAVAVACGVNHLSTASYVKAANLPCVFFHATDDDKVGVQESRNAVNTINASNPPIKAKLVEYPTGQHWIWSKVFGITERPWNGNEAPKNVYEWFLMNDIDNPKEVPMQVIPTGLKAEGSATVRNGVIYLDGSMSTGYDKISWTDLVGGVTSKIWDGGTGYKTAQTKILTAGTYKIRLTVMKGTVSDVKDFTIEVPSSTQPIPTDPFKPTHILRYSDGRTENVRIETL